MENNKWVVLDCETTGLNPDKDQVVEVAWIWEKDGKLHSRDSYIHSSVPIPPEASGIHHIVDKDLVGAPSLVEYFSKEEFPQGVIVAHNAKFDKAFFPNLQNRKWLCSYRCAMHCFPDAPNHKNQVLRYYLGLDPTLPTTTLAPHRALYDALVTVELLEFMLKDHTIEELLELQDRPVLQSVARFGKYKGQLWKDIDRGYLRWMINQDSSGGIDEDLKYTARYWLNH